MRCIKCGRKSKEAYCERCYLEETHLIKSCRKINLKVCPICERHLYRNIWVRDRIKELVKESLVFDGKIKIDEFDCELNKKEIIVKLTASYGEQKTQQSFSLPINLVKKQCQDCSKKGQYFEAILQLREPKEEIINFIEKEVEKQGNVFINKKLKVRGGIDFYLTSNKFAQKIGKRLQQRFGGELKVSPKLYSKDRHTGKELYRLNVLFRLVGFKKGDIISLNNRIIKIKNVTKKITGVDIINNKNVIIDYTKTKPKLLEVYETSVSKTSPNLEVIHPETYQNIKVENPKEIIQKHIKVVIHNDKVYII